MTSTAPRGSPRRPRGAALPHGTEATLSMLTHDLRLAVRSYRGLELSAYVIDLPVTVAAFDSLVHRDDIVTSLRLIVTSFRLPLATLVDSGPRRQLGRRHLALGMETWR